MSSSTPDRPFSQPDSRQSARSTQREPFVPPRPVLDQVDGRVLDPGTALSVKGVRPRSTVYVGPRLIISNTPDSGQVVERLQEVATSLGWEATVHVDDQEKAIDTRPAAVPGVVRLDL